MSTTTVAAKLRITAYSTLWLSDPGHALRLSPLPQRVRTADSPDNADVVVMFAEAFGFGRSPRERHHSRADGPRGGSGLTFDPDCHSPSASTTASWVRRAGHPAHGGSS
jgi:hypothetical protein